MSTKTVSLTELKQNLGTIVNQTSYTGERFILLSHGKERAALISIEDLRLLETIQAEQQQTYVQQQQQALEAARQIREKMAAAGYQIDSTTILEEIREERTDDLLDLR